MYNPWWSPPGLSSYPRTPGFLGIPSSSRTGSMGVSASVSWVTAQVVYEQGFALLVVPLHCCYQQERPSFGCDKQCGQQQNLEVPELGRYQSQD